MVSDVIHNTQIIYDYMCSGRNCQVYLDENGIFQIDNRTWLAKWISPKGDTCRNHIDRVAIQTLQQLVVGIEGGYIHKEKIFKSHVYDEGVKREVWVDHDYLSRYIKNSSRFMESQELSNKIEVLTGMLLLGRSKYLESFKFRDLEDLNVESKV